MTFWIDAQLPPSLAEVLSKNFGVESVSIRELRLVESTDEEIFDLARSRGANVITKDVDFVDLVARRGSPPAVLWVRCGNTSNANLFGLMMRHFPQAIEAFERGESIVEIR